LPSAFLHKLISDRYFWSPMLFGWSSDAADFLRTNGIHLLDTKVK